MPSCSTPPSPTAGAPARGRCAGAHLRPARSAPAIGRSPGAGRPGRGRLAAGDARRSLAQPADAPRARPRPAGAAHRPLGARFRAGARRARGDPHPRGQARRRADGRLAFRAAARRGRGRGALERGARARRALRGAGAQARRRPATASRLARPEPKPPLAARPRQLSVTEIEHWLRDPYTIYAKHVLRLAPLDDDRHAAGRGRPRHRDPRRHRRLRQDVRRQAARRSGAAT